jgi:hypothetical protein
MIPTSAQIEMFPEFTPKEEEALKAVAERMGQMADKYEQQLNGTRADDLQVSGNHYKEMPIQPWAVMQDVLTPAEFRGFLKGNIIKYAMRAGRKEGSDDAGKAKHYMHKLREVGYGPDA